MAWDDSGQTVWTPTQVNAGGAILAFRNARGFSRRTMLLNNFTDKTLTVALVGSFASGAELLVQGTVASGVIAAVTQGGVGSGVFTVTAGSLGAMAAAVDQVEVFVTAGVGATVGGFAAQLYQDG